MTSVACPSPSAPICTNLTIQATRPPPVNEQTRKYPLLVLTPPNLRQSPRRDLFLVDLLALKTGRE
jgi:hypothetical protein